MKMLAGLMSRWMMPARMRGVQRVGDLDAHLERRIQVERTGGQPIRQRHSVEKLHDDEGAPVLVADVVDRADVRVIQGRRGTSFALESRQRVSVQRKLGAKGT